MIKRVIVISLAMTIVAAPSAPAQTSCVKKQVQCRKITLQPSGEVVYLALSKKNLDKKRAGRFALMATLLSIEGGLKNVIDKVRVATGFKLASKVKKVKVLTPGGDDASVTVKFLITPSVGTVTRNLAITPDSISLAG